MKWKPVLGIILILLSIVCMVWWESDGRDLFLKPSTIEQSDDPKPLPIPQKLPDGKSIFTIPSNWIYQRSASLRVGDTISIFSITDYELLGTFQIAYLRDSEEHSLKTSEDTSLKILDRIDLPSNISSIEIVTSPDEFFSIYDFVINNGEMSLIVALE